MNTNDTQTNDTTAKVDSFRFLKLIKHIHIAGDKSATTLLWLFCSMADGRTGECYPGIDHLAVKTGWSEDTIPRATDKLVTLGLVTVLNRSYQSNLYALNYDALLALKETCQPTDRKLLDAVREKKANKQYRRRMRRSAEKLVAPENGGYKNGVVAPENGGYKNAVVARKLDVCSPQTEGDVARKRDVCSPQTGEFVAPAGAALTTQYRTTQIERLKPNEQSNVSSALKNFGTSFSATGSITGSPTAAGQSHSNATSCPANFVAPENGGYTGEAAPQNQKWYERMAESVRPPAEAAPAPVNNENAIKWLTQEIGCLEERTPNQSRLRLLEEYRKMLADLVGQSAQATQPSQGATA